MMERRGYGILLVTSAMVLWSLAGLFVRLIDLSIADLVLWRSLFAGAALSILCIVSPARGAAFGWIGLGASLLTAVSTSAYAASLTLTSVANVLIVYATLPFVTALLGWSLMGERSSRRMVAASAASLFGVVIVAGQSFRPADMAGNALALFMTVTFAALLLLTRRFGRIDLALTNAVASLVGAAVALPFSSGAIPGAEDLLLLAGFGVLTTALPFLLFLSGGRHVPSTEAALLGLLDVLLGPLWVWLVFSEHPGNGALVGGGIVLAAVVWYLVPGLRNGAASSGRPWKRERKSPCGS